MTGPMSNEPAPAEPAPTEPAPTEPSPTGPAPEPAPSPTFEQRMDTFGREVGAAGERFGREAEAVGQRLAKDPAVQRAADTAARIWGLIVLAVGVWFLADVTIGMDMPAVPWADLWPLGLILIGLFVVVRGMGSRRA
jgi:hypothetical protein